MFSKANLPAGIHSRCTPAAFWGNANHSSRSKPVLLNSAENRQTSSISDHSTVD